MTEGVRHDLLKHVAAGTVAITAGPDGRCLVCGVQVMEPVPRPVNWACNVLPVPVHRMGDAVYAERPEDRALVYLGDAPTRCPHDHPLHYRDGMVLSTCPLCSPLTSVATRPQHHTAQDQGGMGVQSSQPVSSPDPPDRVFYPQRKVNARMALRHAATGTRRAWAAWRQYRPMLREIRHQLRRTTRL